MSLRKSVPQMLLPILESGDHLSRAEFERRYNLLPEVKKAKLIEGKVEAGKLQQIDSTLLSQSNCGK